VQVGVFQLKVLSEIQLFPFLGIHRPYKITPIGYLANSIFALASTAALSRCFIIWKSVKFRTVFSSASRIVVRVFWGFSARGCFTTIISQFICLVRKHALAAAQPASPVIQQLCVRQREIT
jgi:hypothetical protein